MLDTNTMYKSYTHAITACNFLSDFATWYHGAGYFFTSLWLRQIQLEVRYRLNDHLRVKTKTDESTPGCRKKLIAAQYQYLGKNPLTKEEGRLTAEEFGQGKVMSVV